MYILSTSILNIPNADIKDQYSHNIIEDINCIKKDFDKSKILSFNTKFGVNRFMSEFNFFLDDIDKFIHIREIIYKFINNEYDKYNKYYIIKYDDIINDSDMLKDMSLYYKVYECKDILIAIYKIFRDLYISKINSGEDYIGIKICSESYNKTRFILLGENPIEECLYIGNLEKL